MSYVDHWGFCLTEKIFWRKGFAWGRGLGHCTMYCVVLIAFIIWLLFFHVFKK